MGIDVRDLIRNSQLQKQSQDQQDEQQFTERNGDVKTVLFTFTGPEGLIEGGDNQQYEMPIDFSNISMVQQVKEMLTSELQMEPGIDLVLREKQTGEELASIDDMLTAVDNGEGVLVQFIEINKVEDEPE